MRLGDHVYQCLIGCTRQTWTSPRQVRFVHLDIVGTVHRWCHQASNRGFIILECENEELLQLEQLRALIQYSRNWGGSNMGCFIVPYGGIEASVDKGLPYYGYLRVAILDTHKEKIIFGTDSSRFQVLLGAIAQHFGIPAGGESAEQIAVGRCNQLGPSLWKRSVLEYYSREKIFFWHPLVLSALFPQLYLSLDGLLHDSHNVFVFHPHRAPVTSFQVLKHLENFKSKTIYLCTPYLVTPIVKEILPEHCIYECCPDPIEVLNNLGYQSTQLSFDLLHSSPQLWSAYLKCIVPISSIHYRDVATITEKEIYIVATSAIKLRRLLPQLDTEKVLIIQSNFHISPSELNRFKSWSWFYRGEVFHKGTLPVAIQNAFIHFNTFESPLLLTTSWQERFSRKGTGFTDRLTGTEVEVIPSIPINHPWLLHGVRLSMLHHVYPILFYDRTQEVLVLKKASTESAIPQSNITQHLLRHMYMLGISFSERGPLFTEDGTVYMSLLTEGDWSITKKEDDLFDKKNTKGYK